MNRLKELREKHSKTTLEISQIIGVSQRTIQKYEKGTLDISTETLDKFAELYNCSIDYILCREDSLSNEYIGVFKEAQDKELPIEEIKNFIEYLDMKHNKKK